MDREINKLILLVLIVGGTFTLIFHASPHDDFLKTQLILLIGALLIVINPKDGPSASKTTVTTPTPSTTITSETKES